MFFSQRTITLAFVVEALSWLLVARFTDLGILTDDRCILTDDRSILTGLDAEDRYGRALWQMLNHNSTQIGQDCFISAIFGCLSSFWIICDLLISAFGSTRRHST